MKTSKRLFDLCFAALGLLVLWPLLAVIAIAIKLDNGGPVFFRQVRVGHKGASFRIWKFRTMVVNAEELGKQLTVGRDPRITRVGGWLRRAKLDELPQLINVLAGEMSFVGPRPEVPKYVALYTPDQRRVLDLVPGITDEASIAYRTESEVLNASPDPEQTYIHDVMPAKIAANLAYAESASVWRDLGVVLRTVACLFH